MTEYKDVGKIYDDFFGRGKDTVPSADSPSSPASSPDQDKPGKDLPPLFPEEEEGDPEKALNSLSAGFLDDIRKIREMVEADISILDGTLEDACKEDPAKPLPPASDAPSGKASAPGAETAKEKEEKPPMEELEELIGLTTIKEDVKELIDLVKARKLRTDQGMKSVPVSLHLVFSGNPGTGKTTVARILARLYKEIGVLSKGQLVEVDRSGLVAGYVGQTAIKTQEKISQAMGGILFIDEAYALAKEGADYGQEAIDTILKAMEDNRGDFVVIVAGYTDLMKKFIDSNPGLKSRFNKYFEFPDYTAQELMDIFRLQCRKYDYSLDPDAEGIIQAKITQMELTKGRNFANARDVRNLFESIITNQATRVAHLDNPGPDQLRLILTADVLKDEIQDQPLSEAVQEGEA